MVRNGTRLMYSRYSENGKFFLCYELLVIYGLFTVQSNLYVTGKPKPLKRFEPILSYDPNGLSGPEVVKLNVV